MSETSRRIELNHDILAGPQLEHYLGNPIDAFTTDVDGTYVPDNTLELPTNAMARESYVALQSGLHIRLQTARGLGKTAYLVDDLIHIARLTEDDSLEQVRWHGLSNGAQIYDAKEAKMTAEYALPQAATAEIVHYLQREGFPHWVSDNGEADWAPVDLSALQYRYHDLGLGAYYQIDNPHNNRQEYIPDNPLVIVAHDLHQAAFDEVMAYGNSFADQNVVAIEYGAEGEGEAKHYKVFLLHKFANKRHALQVIAERSGVDIGNTLVVGDSSNDAIMLKTAVEQGGVGAAMGNGSSATKAEATILVREQARDGARQALRVARQLHAA